MVKLLNLLDIPSTRISAIDGGYVNFKHNITDFERNLSQYEIACTLSHIKAISYLDKLKGNYFIIFEDDINFNNIKYINKTLESIINTSPKFDILLISKMVVDNLNFFKDANYVNIKESTHSNYFNICGTSAYIITRDGINQILKHIIFDFIEKNFILKTNISFDVSDVYLYKLVDTYVYKYNFISTDNNTSIIHENHLDFHKYSAE